MAKKKLTKIVWFGAEKDEDGKPLLPKLSESEERHLEGLNEGEFYLHNDDDAPALFIRTNKNRIVAIGGGDLEYLSQFFLRKDRDDIAHGHITFEKGIKSIGTTETDDVIVNESIHSKEFVSGFTGGKGWAIRMKEFLNSSGVTENRSEAELDDLIVRGTLRVFEFIVSQMLGENDNRTFTAMLEVDHYEPSTGKVWLNTQNGKFYNPFRVNDIILVQQFNGMPSEDNSYYVVKQYELVISEVGVGDLSLGEDRLDWVKFRNFSSPMEGATESLITKGDTFVRIDNLSNPDRKGIIQLMTVGADTPYMDIIYGKKTDPDNSLKGRFGNLKGVYNPLFGWLSDFGAYLTNLYAVGEFRIAHTGEDVADAIEMTKGAFKTNFKQIAYDITEEDNLLTNGVFAGDLSMWQLGETDLDFLTVDGKPVYANRNLMSTTNSFCGVDEWMGRNMMRIYDSKIVQPNGYIDQPPTHKEYEEGEDGEVVEKEKLNTLYLNVVYYCRKAGQIWVGFTDDNGNPIESETTTIPNVSEDIVEGVDERMISVSGEWDGVGNFTISTTGDVYIDRVTLTDEPLENLKAEYSTRIEQDARRIALIAEKNTAHESKIAELEVTAENISQTVVSVQGTAADAKSIANSAQSAADSAYSRANSAYSLADNAYDYAYSNASTIRTHANYISLWSGSFDSYGKLTSSSGAVLTSNFATLFSEQIDENELVTRAEISVYVKDEISNIQLTADKITFEGYTNINNSFVVDSDGTVNIGKFIVDANGLYTSQENAYINFNFDGSKFLRINNLSNSALLNGRNDDGIVAQFNTYGSGKAMYLYCNHTSGYALHTYGRVLLEGIDANRTVRIHNGCYFTNWFELRYQASSSYNAKFSADASNRLMIYSAYWPLESSVSNGYMYVDGSGYVKVKGATRI